MQSILAIDFSAQPCEVTVSHVSGSSIEVIERHSVPLPLLRVRASTAGSNDEAARSIDAQPCLDEITDTISEELIAPVTATTSAAGQREDTPTAAQDGAPQATVQSAVAAAVTALRETIQKVSAVYSATAVIVPPLKHLGLNLNLPFGDSKNLEKIVDLEVQDVVPFDLDDFVVQYASLDRAEPASTAPQPKSFDVHVAMMPKRYIRNILGLCRLAGVDPSVLTVPSSAVGAIFHLAKDFFRTDTAIIRYQGDEYSIALYIGGKVRGEHVVRSSSLVVEEDDAQGDPELRAVFTALRLIVAAAERRYSGRIQTIYLLGFLPYQSKLHQLMGKPVEPLTLDDVLTSAPPGTGIAPLAAFFAQDESPVTPLSNFRTRQFSFRPKFGELLRVFSETAPHTIAAICAVCFLFAGLYGLREFNLSNMRTAVITQLQTVIPTLRADSKDILADLRTAETSLSNELGVLGSPAKSSPLDALVEILRLLPEESGVTITALKVSGTRAQITGVAPALSTVSAVEKALRANTELFSKITAVPGSASGSKFNFSVELVLAQ